MKRAAEIEMAVFEAASHIGDPAARDEFLQRVFRDNPAEGERMRAMLATEEASTAWFDSVTATRVELAVELVSAGSPKIPAPVANAVLTRIDDRFTILEPLGEGSGGRVFLAEQMEPIRRSVAVKFLQPGLESSGFLDAFRRECQTLALLNHPNIAGIIDAGATEGGIPYCVMELIKGDGIIKDCDSRRETLRARIELFLQVCSAISHAHQKGIIHRDIKPSNILMATVDGVPCPKVIDFGIAAAIAAGREGASVPAAGTPGYMSPEERNPACLDIDTRADVFSLGVVLRELLFGANPGDPSFVAGVSVEAWLSLQPSRLLQIAESRRLQPRQLLAAARGDLDAILAKATAPDRWARYETVVELANDLRRHLDGKPVSARPQHRRYLLSKFIQRNWLVCSIAVTASAAVLVGGVLSFVSYLNERNARRDASHARAVAADLLQAARARETITQAAIFLSQGQAEEADAVLRDHPLSGIEPLSEAAYVFRFLGERNARMGRWTQASTCFEYLAKSNRSADPEQVAAGKDLSYSFPAFLEAGNQSAYDSLREEVLARASGFKKPIAVEQTVKCCLLRPASRRDLDRLRPLADFMANAIQQRLFVNHDAWFAMALSLFEYRQGDFEAALKWSRPYADPQPKVPRFKSRAAGMKWIEAMACWRLGRRDQAQAAATEARRLMAKFAGRALVDEASEYDESQGTWYAWAVARILQREAEALVGPESSEPAPQSTPR